MAFHLNGYSNFHDDNQDWIVNKIKNIDDAEAHTEELAEAAQASADASQASAEASQVSAEASQTSAEASQQSAENAAESETNAAQSELSAKNYADHIADPVAGIVSNWLSDHITPTTPIVDDTLTISGAAADAKATGDKIKNLKSELVNLNEKNYIEGTITNQTQYYDRFIVVVPVSEIITSVNISFDFECSFGIQELRCNLFTDDTNDAQTRGTPVELGVAPIPTDHVTFSMDNITGLTLKQYAKIYFSITAVESSINGMFRFNNLNISINENKADQADLYKWGTADYTLTFEYKISDILAYTTKDEFSALGLTETEKPFTGCNVNTTLPTSSDAVHAGYRIPIKALKKITSVNLKNIYTVASGVINCSILDSNLNNIATAANSYKNVGVIGENVLFTFNEPVDINTAYGFLEISRPSGKINYTPLTENLLNTEIAVVPTSEIRGYFKDTAESDWVRLTASSTLNFNLVYEITRMLPCAETKMDEYQNEQAVTFSNKTNVIECGAGKRYQTIREAVEAGCAAGGTVIVYPGVYDLTQEFADVLANHNGHGNYLYNGIHLLFMAGSYVKALLNGSDSWAYMNFEPFRIKGDAIIEGLNIEASNTRYCVHDEMAGTGVYSVKYINCIMKYTNNRQEATYTQCIGGGLGRNGFIDIEGGCYTSENEYADTTNVPAISYHNGTPADCDGKIFIKDVYISDQNYFRFGNYGNSTIKTPVYISGCSMGDSIMHFNENPNEYTNENFAITEWNNTIR